MYVYVDILFLLNLIMNIVILVFTAKTAGFSWKWNRLLAASSIGSFYAVGALIPELHMFYFLPVKICVSGILLLISFGWQSLKQFLFGFSVFYVVSFIFGGAVIGWLFFVDDGQWLIAGDAAWTWSISWTHVLGGSLMAAGLLGLIARSVLAKVARKGVMHKVNIFYSGRTAQVIAMLDTGNRLISPLSKRPVLLVDKQSIVPVLSNDAECFLNGYDPNDWLTEIQNCHDSRWLGRIEPIPYQGIGVRSMLLGFRPDKISIVTEHGMIETSDTIVGIYSGRLSPDGAYGALLHPLLIEGREVTRRRERATQVANY